MDCSCAKELFHERAHVAHDRVRNKTTLTCILEQFFDELDFVILDLEDNFVDARIFPCARPAVHNLEGFELISEVAGLKGCPKAI